CVGHRGVDDNAAARVSGLRGIGLSGSAFLIQLKLAASRRRQTIPDIGGLIMIRGLHGMFYSSNAKELRSFFKDKLGLKGTDTGGGWWIFDAPEADLGVHPTEERDVPSG